MRRPALVALALAIGAVLVAVPLAGTAIAQTTPTTTFTTLVGRPDTECISANPRPDCYQTKEFGRSTRGHLLLFAIMGIALAGIATVVVRSTIRRDRARA